MFFPAGKIQVVIRPALAIPVINYSQLLEESEDGPLTPEPAIKSLFTNMDEASPHMPTENKVVVSGKSIQELEQSCEELHCTQLGPS